MVGFLYVPVGIHCRFEYVDEAIQTVRDMVLWLDWIRQRQSSASPRRVGRG